MSGSGWRVLVGVRELVSRSKRKMLEGVRGAGRSGSMGE